MENSILQPVVCAILGALAIKLLELAELAKIPKIRRPDFHDWIYWVSFVIMPAIGGFLAYMYVTSGVALKPILACNVGISAPLILRAMAQTLPIQLQPKTINSGDGA